MWKVVMVTFWLPCHETDSIGFVPLLSTDPVGICRLLRQLGRKRHEWNCTRKRTLRSSLPRSRIVPPLPASLAHPGPIVLERNCHLGPCADVCSSSRPIPYG